MNEQELKKQNLTIVDQSQEIVVFSKEDNESANGLLKRVMTAKKAIKEYWKDPKEKAYQAHKAVTAKETEMLKPINMAETRIKGKISNYLTILENKRIEQEKGLREQAKEEGIQVKVKVEKAEAPTGQISKTLWRAEVVDKALVPEEYKIVNQSALDSLAVALKDKAKVPGVRFYSKISVSTRG